MAVRSGRALDRNGLRGLSGPAGGEENFGVPGVFRRFLVEIGRSAPLWKRLGETDLARHTWIFHPLPLSAKNAVVSYKFPHPHRNTFCIYDVLNT